MDTLKKRVNHWRYLGLSKETVEVYADRVSIDNLDVLCTESVLLGALCFFTALLLSVYNYVALKIFVLIGCAFVSCFISIVANLFRKNVAIVTAKDVNIMIFALVVTYYVLVIFMGVYHTDNYASLMVGATLITQVSFDVTPRRNLFTLGFFFLTFVILDHLFKPFNIFFYDLINVSVSAIMGLVISWKKAKVKWEHKEAIELIERSNSKLYVSSTTDPLTGLTNRRNSFDRLEVLAAQACVSGKRIVCMVMDLDEFKRYNDTFGHPAGDELLENLGKLLREVAEKHKINVSRIGGEEFMAYWMGEEETNSAIIAREILENVRKLPHLEAAEAENVTISIGIYDNEAQVEDTGNRVYSKADRAVYAAKKNGRNRIEYYDNSIL